MAHDVADGMGSYAPDVKCCSYLPTLANYLAGEVLLDDTPSAAAGRASLVTRIEGRAGISPLCVGMTPVYQLLYRFGSGNAFGHSKALRCPHYVEASGACGIWRHRNAVCATYFCKHERGETGRAFWEAVRNLLGVVEVQLARWCVLELDLGAPALAHLFPSPAREPPENAALGLGDLDGTPDEGARRALWGRWYGRELDLYVACARMVRGIALDEVLRRCGPEARARAALVAAAWERFAAPVPERLHARRLQVLSTSERSCRVVAYSPLDPLEMPRALFDALHHFDGRSAHDALAAVVAEGGPALAPSLVRKMVDFGILEAAEPEVPK
jgi:hypothetical protein